MGQTLTVGLVRGVNADKWLRVWRERMRENPLEVTSIAEEDAVEALGSGADLVVTRLPLPGEAEGLHVIPLWEEIPVAVAARDHPVKAFDAVTLADLEGEELRSGWDEPTLDLVAAGHGVALMPQSVFRSTGRRDLVAREVTDADRTRVGLVWRGTASGPLHEEFIGIVRGRTARSSRGAGSPGEKPEPKPDPKRERKASARRDQRSVTSSKRSAPGRKNIRRSR